MRYSAGEPGLPDRLDLPHDGEHEQVRTQGQANFWWSSQFADLGHRPVTIHRPSETAAQPSPVAETTKSSTLHRFLPRELAAKLEAARAGGEMVGERRVVTMLFCDIKGSTAAAEQLDPEEWTEIINGAFEQMIRPIYKYEGTVARLMGDAILAFFGAPIAHEDDPVRAVLAGLDIIAGFDAYQEEVLNKFGLPIKARVGINTGMVVVGAVGSDLRMEYTAMGDAINLAARMEQTAEPGTVQIAEETLQARRTGVRGPGPGGYHRKGQCGAD